MITVAPGDILLTSGVGGPAAKWRDKLLTRSILAFQCIKEADGNATRSHAELITSAKGDTFAARWRTRHRANGLSDYIGSHITIIRPKRMSPLLFKLGWCEAEMDQFDGMIYPVHRLLLQGVSAFIFPWVVKIGFGPFAICSEIVAKFFNGLYYDCARIWRGVTPAMIENWGLWGRDFQEIFKGLLTEELMIESNLPILQPYSKSLES